MGQLKIRMSKQMTKKTHGLAFILGWLLLTASSPVTSAVPGDLQYERRANDSADSEAEMMSFPPSIFPHWRHRIHYRCDACHDSLFEMKRGGTPVSMDLMKEGKVCGACHNGQLAFGSDFQSCNRCHVKIEE
jgi:c(7)-type cytochrome triheme protein